MNLRARVLRHHDSRERRRKLETAFAGFGWLVGCVLLCIHPEFGKDATWGLQSKTCGMYTYSVSASMTGLYPKLWGSLMVTLFAVLVTQRITNGLCASLKIVWLKQYSGLDSAAEPRRKDGPTAQRLWARIQTIEFLSYASGAALIGLAAFDTKDFPKTHKALATCAFAGLYRMDFKIGMLERDFAPLFPGWSNPTATRVFMFGYYHLILVFALIFVSEFAHGAKRCDLMIDPIAHAGSVLLPAHFGATATAPAARELALWLLSAFHWSYACDLYLCTSDECLYTWRCGCSLPSTGKVAALCHLTTRSRVKHEMACGWA